MIDFLELRSFFPVKFPTWLQAIGAHYQKVSHLADPNKFKCGNERNKDKEREREGMSSDFEQNNGAYLLLLRIRLHLICRLV